MYFRLVGRRHGGIWPMAIMKIERKFENLITNLLRNSIIHMALLEHSYSLWCRCARIGADTEVSRSKDDAAYMDCVCVFDGSWLRAWVGLSDGHIIYSLSIIYIYIYLWYIQYISIKYAEAHKILSPWYILHSMWPSNTLEYPMARNDYHLRNLYVYKFGGGAYRGGYTYTPAPSHPRIEPRSHHSDKKANKI